MIIFVMDCITSICISSPAITILIFFFTFFSFFLLFFKFFLLYCSELSQVGYPVVPLFNFEAVYPLLALCMICFLVEPCSTLFLLMPQPGQDTALFLGFGVSLVMSPIVFAWLMATYCIPGWCCSDLISPGLMIKCWNWSFLSNPALKPWNLCIVVAQLGTSGQIVTEQHDCFILHHFVFIGMGTCLMGGKHQVNVQSKSLYSYRYLRFVLLTVKVNGSWGRRLLAVAGEVTRHGRAHPYSWLITIVCIGSKESEESHRSKWKLNSWACSLLLCVSTLQTRASPIPTQY